MKFGKTFMMEKITDLIFEGEKGEEPDSIQVIKLIPYQDIQKECTYLVG